jgi:predicted PhzF superfamily epimerase YddE/YHI9
MHGLAGMPGRSVVAQGEMVSRPSFLHLDVAPEGDGWATRVGGGVRFVGDGRFTL